MHVAAEHGHASNLSVLVEAGASLLIRDHLGMTPLDVAEKAEHEESMIVLRAAADKIEAQRVETLSILQEAAAQVSLFLLLIAILGFKRNCYFGAKISSRSGR